MRLKDKNGSLFNYRENNNGAVLTKGKKEVYIIFKTVNQGKKARLLISKHSFNQLFTKGKKIKILGPNVSSIKII